MVPIPGISGSSAISSETSIHSVAIEFIVSCCNKKSPTAPVVPSVFVYVPFVSCLFPFVSVLFEREFSSDIEDIPASSRDNNVPSPFSIFIEWKFVSSEFIIPSPLLSKSDRASKPLVAMVPSVFT